MKLFIDAGNSRVKWALQENSGWSVFASGRSEFANALKESVRPGSTPENVLVSSTRNTTFNHQLSVLIRDLFELQAEFIRPQRRACGVMNRYEPVESLGADRWAALVAVRSLCHTPAIAIDCGTAVTIDALNADGIFEGGVILPGMELSLQALDRADNLEPAEYAEPDVFSRSTHQAMYSGVVHGLAGGINRIVLEMRKNLGQGVSIYLTGGDSELMHDRIEHNIIREPDLVLIGLKVIEEGGT